MSRLQKMLAATRERNRDDRMVGDPFISMNFVGEQYIINGTEVALTDILGGSPAWGDLDLGTIDADGIGTTSGVIGGDLFAQLGPDVSMVVQLSIDNIVTFDSYFAVHDIAYFIDQYARLRNDDLQLYYSPTTYETVGMPEEDVMRTMAMTLSPGKVFTSISGGPVSKLIYPPVEGHVIEEAAFYWTGCHVQRLELYKLPFSELQLRRMSQRVVG
jgi:hypothetical protein